MAAPSQESLLLHKQLKDLMKSSVDGFSAGLVDDSNIFEWSVTIIGPPDTLYFLSFAKTINVEEVYLSSDVQNEIDKLNIDLNNAANTLSDKTNESSEKIRSVIDTVRCVLIVVAAVMLILALIGFVPLRSM
ncbi:uncharacterized protein A4U43_C03F30130 [Asparagus officinalis]|uniref:UBC core domain-containing protein n=1 Tax=Asparagus officinalis TaxID=4686 RepID=A0A5P1FET8_ASPOF|nr:uncharacterized protein A4U43_C03F30130 [Asparagus officinalis]